MLAFVPAVSSAQDAAPGPDAQWTRALPDITVSERGCSTFDLHEFRQALRVEARALSQRSNQPYVELRCEGTRVRVVVRDEPEQVGLQRVVPIVASSGFERELALLVSQRLFSDWLNSQEHRDREAWRLRQPPKRERRRLNQVSEPTTAVERDLEAQTAPDRRWNVEGTAGLRLRDLSKPFVTWLSGLRLGLWGRRWAVSLGGGLERGQAKRAAGSILLQAVHLEAAVRRRWVIGDAVHWAVWLGYEQGFVWLRGDNLDGAGESLFARSFSTASGAIGQAHLRTGPVFRLGELYAAARFGGGYTLPTIRANILDELSGDEQPVTVHGFYLGAELALGVTW